jgi:hypothetical protein
MIDTALWKLTLPVDTSRPGRPDEIINPRASIRPWYVIDTDRAELMFRCPANGVRTSGTRYPRTELREMVRNTTRLAGWDSRAGFHQLTMHARIPHVTVEKPDLVCAQVHDGSDDVLQVRLEGRRLFVECDGDDRGTLDPDYPIGSRFRLRIAAAKAGLRVAYWHQDYGVMPYLIRDIPRVTGRGWYFKAGCYLQTNMAKGEPAGAYGEVAVSALTVFHQAA